MKHTVYGKVKGGAFDNVRHLMESLRLFEGRAIEITIKPRQARWTDQQRKYLFSAIYPHVAALCGCSNDQAREGMKDMYLSYHVNGLKCTKSEADLTLESFEVYLNQIDLYCVENYGSNLPEPE